MLCPTAFWIIFSCELLGTFNTGFIRRVLLRHSPSVFFFHYFFQFKILYNRPTHIPVSTFFTWEKLIKSYYKKCKGPIFTFPCFIVNVYYQVKLKTRGPIDWVCKIPPFIMVLVMEAHNMFEWWPVLGLTHTPQHTQSYSHLQNMLHVDLLRIFLP